MRVRAQAAATTCYVAAHPRVAGVSGRYFADCNEALPSPAATDRQEAARLWRISEAIADARHHHHHDRSADAAAAAALLLAPVPPPPAVAVALTGTRTT